MLITTGNVLTDSTLRAAVIEKEEAHRLSEYCPETFSRLNLEKRSRFLQLAEQAGSPSDITAETCAQALRELPIQSKQDLRDAVSAFLRENNDPKEYFSAFTTGSTGTPIETYFRKDYYVNFYARRSFWLKEAGVTFNHSENLLLYLAGGPKAEGYKAQRQPGLDSANVFQLSVHSSRNSEEEVVRRVEEIKPKVIHSTPSAALRLVEILKGQDKAGIPKLELLLLGAEAVYGHQKASLEGFFSVPVLSGYGLTEVGGTIAEQCLEAQGYHINCLDYWVEIVDDQGDPVPPGTEGEILISNLWNEPIRLQRYRTGDFGVLREDKCPCGRISPRIASLTGRQITRFLGPDGSHYQPYFKFQMYYGAIPYKQFQFVQTAWRELSFYYVAESNLEDHPMLRALVREIIAFYDGRVTLLVHRVPSIKQEGRKLHNFLNMMEVQQQAEHHKQQG